MFHDPIQQGSLKADVFAGFFALDPLVLQNFRALGEELLVKGRVSNELRLVVFRRRHLRFFFHKTCGKSTIKHLNWTRASRNLFRPPLALTTSDASLRQSLT